METFGTMARRWRGGLTQVEASSKMGILQSTISKIETDSRRPSVRILCLMVEAYGISAEELGDAVRLLGQLETADEVDE